MAHNNNLLVTIAIPTYNRADGYLQQAIESAVDQTYKNIEIVVSDNCSSDNTETVVKSFKDTRIRYYRHKQNIGPNNNFNFCLEQAKGKYFLLLTDDDLIDKDFVSVCMNAASSCSDIGIIRTGTRIIDSKGKIIHEHPNRVKGLPTEEFFRGWFANKTTLYLCSTLFNTKRLKEIGGFHSKKNLFQDVVAEVKLASKFGRLDIQDVKASFRKHGSESTFAAKVSDWCEDSLDLLNLMCELVPKESKKVIKTEGMRFFSKINYNRAKSASSSGKCFIAYFIVFKKFKYRYLPTKNQVFFLVYRFIYGTPVHRIMQFIKEKIRQTLAY